MPLDISSNDLQHGLRWLHLTDLHIGIKDESQKTAIASLLESIDAGSKDIEYDLVILSGDLAYSGKKDEYDLLETLVINPLRNLDSCSKAIFIAAPGNHDLDCDIGLPVLWHNLGAARQSIFFNLDEAGTKTRSSRAAAFQEYAKFVQRCNILSVDPTIKPASLEKISIRGRNLAIVSVVTAFFSDKDVPDFQKGPAPVHPIRTLLQTLEGDTSIIVLGHHPLSWFSVETEKHLRSLFLEKNALYVNGHEHEITSQFGGRGLLSIGFGAIYQNAPEAPAKQHYRNSFAICELNESLHIRINSWDSDHGKWRLDQNLPGDFIDESDCLKGGYCLSLPSTRIATNANRPYTILAASIRSNLELDNCIWLASDGTKRWVELLCQIGRFRNIPETYNLRTQHLAAGHHQFRLKDRGGNYLVYVVSGAGDILTYDLLQAINTELDTQDYDGCIVATLGSLSEEATTLTTRLKLRKSIVVLEREHIIRDVIRLGSAELRMTIASQNPADIKIYLLITDDGIALLRQERISTAWFDVVNENGLPYQESDPIVLQLRNDMPEFKSVRYRSICDTQQAFSNGIFDQSGFDLQAYLDANYSYFDDVKYAPLAALGFRFRKTSLSEIYVSATANVNGDSKNTQTIDRAVGEFIESLNLPRAQRDQLESQMRSRFGIERTAEVGAARQLYQRYNNVVVLGDPGSGKTCFVKHEILAYCKPPLEGGSWYTNHLPIYVSLAEASRLSNDTTPLLEICEILSARRGIKLPKAEILKALSAGRAALFFDGLDEVGFIEKRIQLIAEIDNLIRTQAHRGNRFVLASRPAAVQPVEIPEGLTYLHLKGLSEPEMRVLAGRVLTIRVGEMEETGLTDEESALVERLLEDTKHSPGIARLARNPLLLTLLVLIYANTGAISAKRHLIYTQAIKTLVSVRGRDTREQQISEADLRTRLGALAVAIFSREIDEIPRRSEVLKVIAPFMDSENSALEDDAGNAFLQEVAEATGLLSIHGENGSRSLDLITFMHYSFLEYYAAAGLLSRDYLKNLPQLAANPRWKDVITLMFGILSEQGDVTPAIEALLSVQSPPQDITKSKLLLAMDCAAECDVPPIATQLLLSKAVADTVSSGVGRVSGKMRDALAGKLAYFLQGAAAKFDIVLVDGLKSANSLTAAAFADLIARLPLDLVLSASVKNAFTELLTRTTPATTVAVLYAVERRDELRIDLARQAITRALKGNLAEKHAALKVLAVVPAYYENCSELVEGLLDDSNEFIASTAAQCVLTSSQSIGVLNDHSPILEKLLIKLSLVGDEGGFSLPGITLDQQQIESMISSGSKGACELALRYTPLIRDDAQFIYQTLLRGLKVNEEPRHKSACLDSLRTAPRAIDLITIADTDLICNHLQAPQRNVRLAATRLLAEMPDDEQVIRSLQDNLRALKASKSSDIEISETAKALAKHARRSARLRPEIMRLVLEHLPNVDKGGFGDVTTQQHLVGLLTICESLNGDSDNSMAMRLLGLAEDFRTPENIRRHSLRTFGRIADPSTENANILIRLLKTNDIKFNEALYTATLSFVNQCKRKVEFVRRVYSSLCPLRDCLHSSWLKAVSTNTESIDLSGARDIRDAVICIEELIVQYGEFAARAKVSG